jgi:hypothetical protein
MKEKMGGLPTSSKLLTRLGPNNTYTYQLHTTLGKKKNIIPKRILPHRLSHKMCWVINQKGLERGFQKLKKKK